MDIVNALMWLGIGVAALLAVAVTWEIARSIYFWAGAKLLGWSQEELFKRKHARQDRIAEREREQARRDAEAFRDNDRRHYGVTFATLALADLVWHMDLPWWHMGLIVAAVYAGLNMAAGLAWKWWG